MPLSIHHALQSFLTNAVNFSRQERLEIFWKAQQVKAVWDYYHRYFKMFWHVVVFENDVFFGMFGFQVIAFLGLIGHVLILLILRFDKQYAEPAFWYPRMISLLAIFSCISTVIVHYSYRRRGKPSFEFRAFSIKSLRSFLQFFFIPISNSFIISLEFLWLFVKFVSTTRWFLFLNSIDTLKFHVASTILIYLAATCGFRVELRELFSNICLFFTRSAWPVHVFFLKHINWHVIFALMSAMYLLFWCCFFTLIVLIHVNLHSTVKLKKRISLKPKMKWRIWRMLYVSSIAL